MLRSERAAFLSFLRAWVSRVEAQLPSIDGPTGASLLYGLSKLQAAGGAKVRRWVGGWVGGCLFNKG